MILIYLPVSAGALLLTKKWPGGVLVGQSIGYAVWFASLAVLFRVKYAKPFWSSLGWRRAPFWLSKGLALGVGTMVGIALLTRFLYLPDIESPIRKLLEDPGLRWLAIFSIALVGPVAEELVFRGFAQPLLTSVLGMWPGIFLTALPFGLLHAPQLDNSWKNVALIVLAGAAFGWLRQRTDSTLASGMAHATYNSALLAGFFLGKAHG